MKPGAPLTGRRVLDGAAFGFAANALMVPTGLATVVYLTRSLGPEIYGTYGALIAVVMWVQYTLSAAMGRVAVQHVSAAPDPLAAASAMLRLHALVGAIALGALWLAAGPLAAALGEPALAWPLRLLALEVPVHLMVAPHSAVLIATGRLRLRAAADAVRWVARLVAIVVLVESGLELEGALLGCVLASVAELIVVRWAAGIPLARRASIPWGKLAAFGGPLVVAGAALRVLDGIDLAFVKALASDERAAGWYAAAQNLAIMPGMAAAAAVGPLIAWITAMKASGDDAGVARAGGQTMRVVAWVMAIAGAGVGCAPDGVLLLFGAEFRPAAGLLAVLVVAGIGRLTFAFTTALLVGLGKPTQVAWVALPVALVALAGYAVLVPWAGVWGAAAATAALSAAGAGALARAAAREGGFALPVGVLARAVAVAIVLGIAGWWVHTPGLWVIAKGLVLAALAAGAMMLLDGEATSDARELLRRRLHPGAKP
jgi:O-antigen/teichoic acid export membrane protein